MPDAQEPPQSDSMPITFIIGTEVFPPVPMSSLPDMSHLHLSAFSGWLRAHHPPTRRPSGRPNGPTDYPDLATFIQEVIAIKRLFIKKGIKPTQPRVAQYLIEIQEDRAQLLHEHSATRLQRKRRSVVRRLQRLVKAAGRSWSGLT